MGKLVTGGVILQNRQWLAFESTYTKVFLYHAKSSLLRLLVQQGKDVLAFVG